MQKYQNSIQDLKGNAVAGASISVYIFGTASLATIYSDNGVTPIAPGALLSDAEGEFAFYAANGRYNVQVIAAGLASQTTYDVLLFDPADAGITSVKNYGATGDGTTDDTAAIQAALSAIASTGGVLEFPAATYKFSSTLMLPSNVTLSGYGATLLWFGGASVCIKTASTGITSDAGIKGAIIDGGSTATKILELNSAYHCSFRSITLKSNSTTNVALYIGVNTSGAVNADGNRNSVFNEFTNVLQEGTCGTAIQMIGNSVGPTVVTLNTFVNFNSQRAAIRGIDFHSWVDSNYFAGVTRVNLVANNAIGVEWNTGTPASNVGVYSNNFSHLAVDTFGTYTGRVGIKMNWTKINKVEYYFNDPPAEGGAYSFDANTQSYYVFHQPGLTGSMIVREKLTTYQGADNGIFSIGGTNEITTNTIGYVAGLNRTGSGYAYLNLVGDTTYTAYGAQLIRTNGGANTATQLNHRGTGGLDLIALDAGGSIGLKTSNGYKFLASDSGIAFYGNAVTAQPTGYGTPTNISKTSSLPGTSATLSQVGGTLAALIADLKQLGILGS